VFLTKKIMSRTPLISICRRCEDEDERDSGNGELLYKAVKSMRKKLGLKEVFDLDGVKCLGMCRSPCNVMFEGKKRSTYVRTQVHAIHEARAVVLAAVAYSELQPGEELPERRLPGLSGD
jgi:predicted metal-binding protein